VHINFPHWWPCHTCSWVLPVKLTAAQLLTKFSELFAIQWFIAMIIIACHWFQLWARLIQSPPFNHIIFRFILISSIYGSWDSDWLRAGRLKGWSSSPDRGKIFLLSTSSRPVLGPTQPPIQWVPRYLSLAVKQLGGEADHSPPTSAEVMNTWICMSAPPYVFMA
jgi:hypothetical protein